MAGSLTGALCQAFPEAEIYTVASDEWPGLVPDYHGLKNLGLPDAPETSAAANVIFPPGSRRE